MTFLTAPRQPGSAFPPAARFLDTGRLTGLFYLALAVAGGVGFLLVRPTLFAAGDPAATWANLLEHEQVARLAIGLELLTVVAQSLAALWFYLLFRGVDAFAAATIAVFGMVNAVAVLTSAAFLATGLDSALGESGPGGTTPHLMLLVSENLWAVGNLFFGLWLVPMGWCVLRSGWMPRALGRVLVVGGVGYVVSAFVALLVRDAEVLAGVLVVPATVGELWMVGQLLIRGGPAAAPAARD